MEAKKHNKPPLKETTKDDSSDVERMQQDKAAPPPQPANPDKNQSREAEEAQKGHS